MGVTCEVGLSTDRDLLVPMCLRNTTSFIPPRYLKSHGMSHYTNLTMQLEKINQKILVKEVSLKRHGQAIQSKQDFPK